jgi:hypothetical protein
VPQKQQRKLPKNLFEKRFFGITCTVEEFSFQNMMGVKKGMTDTGLPFANYMKNVLFSLKKHCKFKKKLLISNPLIQVEKTVLEFGYRAADQKKGILPPCDQGMIT